MAGPVAGTALPSGRVWLPELPYLVAEQHPRRVGKDCVVSFEASLYTVLDKPFTVEGGHLTPTLKLRRAAIAAQYADLIEKLYAQGTGPDAAMISTGSSPPAKCGPGTVGGVHPQTAPQLHQLTGQLRVPRFELRDPRFELRDPRGLPRNQQRKLVIRRTLRLGPGHPGTLSHEPTPVDPETPGTQAEHVQLSCLW